MSDISSHASRIVQHLKEYADVKLELFKLEAIERNAKIASGAIVAVIIGIAGIFFLLMLSVAAAFWLGEILGAWHRGFLAVSSFYLLLGILGYVFRKSWIFRPVTNAVIDNFIEEQEDEKNEQPSAPAATETSA